MSFLLMVFLALICLIPTFPAPLWGGSPASAALGTLAAVGLIGLHAFWVAHRVSVPLARDPGQRESILTRYDRWRFVHQIVQFVLYGVALVVVGWGWAVREWLTDGTRTLPGVELLTLAPFLAGQILTWAFFYDADRAAHRAAAQLLDADPFAHHWLEGRRVAVTPFGSRWSYITFHLRQKLALVLLPVLLLILRQELDRQFPHLWDGAPWLVNAAAMLSLVVVIVVMPLLIYLALGLRPLPEGLLRERLLTATRRLGFRCTNLLVWDTRHGMANAMVIGLVPWLRFVVFTDRLLEEFTEEEVEAVLGHEIGHIRHHHMLTYLIFLMLSLAVLGAFADHFLLPWLGEAFDSLAQRFPMLPESVGEWLGPGGFLSPLPVVVLILLYIFGVFGFLSRQCERQADIFGCRATSCAEQPCPGHSEATTLPRGGVGLCRTGIHTFIRALDKVALINGISRDRPGFLQSWQHSTIARRVEFLHGLLRDPAQEAVFQRRLLAIKVVLLLGSGLMLAWLVHGHGWQL